MAVDGELAPGHRAPTELVDAATKVAQANAADWFPELDASRLVTDVVRLSARARCILYRMSLHDGSKARQVVIKVRHSDPSLRWLDRFEDERPFLSPQRLMSDEETAAREFDGLRSLAAALSHSDPSRIGVLRPLAALPGHAALILDLAEDPTLRARLLRTSRLRLRGRSPAMPDSAWSNAGAGLRAFHDHAPGEGLPARMTDPGEVRSLVTAYSRFLAVRGAGRATSALLSRVEDVADDLCAALPAELALVPGHGDFVANNMFASASGRITIFDPLVEWQVPRYLDLATLTMSLRLLPVQTSSQGLALRTADLDRYESAVLHGYFGAEPVPTSGLRIFQLLVLLDRWSMLVSKTAATGVVRPAVRAARVRLATRYVRRLGRQLLTRLGDEPR